MLSLPSDVDAPSLLGPWTFEPLQLIPTVVVATLYHRRTRTLARRGQPVPGWRQFSFWTSIALVVLALNSPSDALGEEHFFFMHMLQHVILGDLAPLCFVAGLTGPILRPVLAIGWAALIFGTPLWVLGTTILLVRTPRTRHSAAIAGATA